MRFLLQFFLIISSLFLIQTEVFSQQKNVWKTLGLIKFEMQFSENDGMSGGGQKSRFLPVIEKLDGEEIEVKGYIIPLTGKKAQSHFMFSAYPFANCFFCGNAGPETVMEVYTMDDKKIEYSDDAVLLKGKFKFLGVKHNDIMFELYEAELVENK